MIARVIASAEPRVQLPPIVGGFGSLNLFVAIVGRSGQGKGASQAAANDLFEPHGGALFEVTSIGSGEGIAAAYVDRRRDGDTFEAHQHSESALFDIAEVDTLTALAGRQGSTLMGELRKVWSGERLGFQNRDSTRNLPVEAHKYRAALIAGVQPTRAGALLDDEAGGTPQRFIWLPATDPAAPDRPPEPPQPLTWTMPGEDVFPAVNYRRVMHVCDVAWESIDVAHVQRLRGDGDALDGHALLSRLKVAAALALLDERSDVSADDWELAGVVMNVSDSTRADCRRQINAVAKAVNEHRAEARAQASVIIADHSETVALERCKQRVLEKLENDWTSSAAIRKSISNRLREFFEQAVNELAEAGLIDVAHDEYQGQPRMQLRLTAPVGVTNQSPLAVTPILPHPDADLRGEQAGVTDLSPLPEEIHPSPEESQEGRP